MHHLDFATYFTPDQPQRLRELYSYPENLQHPWVRVNFVSSIDGAVSVSGLSGGLGTPADKTVFDTLRELCDVVVVGAGTARAENYGGAVMNDDARARRVASGLAPVPPILVVSSRASIDPESRLFCDAEVPPILLVGSDADAAAVSRLSDAGADVHRSVGAAVRSVDVENTASTLNLPRILCEGGPSLFGQLITDNAVDELCVTTSPQLVGGNAGRISLSAQSLPTPMMPAHILTDSDGTVLSRWVRQRPRH
ncbi:pyrimidine reductase family protein [Rhodococcus sp. ACPA4]|uniref:pyrimidine reductase family protein n=1 Tax=Rhodococcus TaxID=1827 RepID=UPI000B0F74A3|nr:MULTISPECIES: pyrimidine reductase family protein [Rhodococcus]PBC40819.1 pyrimidine reductase family protein [Rhodococcus sp. ACPA4]ROZ46043.1 pyrimidine reductase family protein [Rhodococcus sp. WS3]